MRPPSPPGPNQPPPKRRVRPTDVADRSATFLAGQRMGLGDAPAPVLAAVADLLGSEIVTIADRTGGMAATPAAVVTGGSGRQLFVKACGSRSNVHTFELYCQEAALAEPVTGLPHVPPLEGVVHVPVIHHDGAEDWIVLAFAAVNGSCVATPWQEDQLRSVLDAWCETRAALWDACAPTGESGLVGMLHGWEVIADDASDPWHEWAEVWAPREQELRTALAAPGLAAHLDLRADNILLDRDGEVWFVDWAHLQPCVPWADPALLLADVVASRRAHDLPRCAADHPALAGIPDGSAQAMVGAIAGFMHSRRDDVRPDMPWNPRWKRAMADALEPFVRVGAGRG